MYHGEVNVTHADLNSFLDVAEKLKVRGLTNDCEKEVKKTPSQTQLRRKNAASNSNESCNTSTPNKKPKISHVQSVVKLEAGVNNSVSVSDDNASFDGGDATGGASDFDTSLLEGGDDANDDSGTDATTSTSYALWVRRVII
jgi:hypothetical protein